MTPEVIQKLQDKATVLTQERKKRGRTVPEELTTQEDLRSFRTVASHPVRLIRVKLIINLTNKTIVGFTFC